MSSLDSSIQNLSELTLPITAKATERELSLPVEKNHSDSSDDTHKNMGKEKWHFETAVGFQFHYTDDDRLCGAVETSEVQI